MYLFKYINYQKKDINGSSIFQGFFPDFRQQFQELFLHHNPCIKWQVLCGTWVDSIM